MLLQASIQTVIMLPKIMLSVALNFTSG